jgi:hypothetical protein
MKMAVYSCGYYSEVIGQQRKTSILDATYIHKIVFRNSHESLVINTTITMSSWYSHVIVSITSLITVTYKNNFEDLRVKTLELSKHITQNFFRNLGYSGLAQLGEPHQFLVSTSFGTLEDFNGSKNSGF